MSLDYVARGEGIKASTVNSLIDAVQGGGNMSPDLIVTGTRTGPQFVAPAAVGSTQLQTQCMFDVKNYILSGWPMAQFQLGFSLQDTLDAVRVHDEDGIENAASAILIYKNSSNCPFSGGTLSGRILREDDFQTNSNVGNTGWVKTQMEGLHGSTYPKLQVWTTTSSVIEVITNAEDRETKQQLSSILSQNGMEEQQLSTLNFLDGCTLQKQIIGEGANSKPSSRTTFKNGVFDSYRVAAKKPWNAMLKAYLVCYNTSEGEEGMRDSDWTWLVPLGDGANYWNDLEGVYTTQLTYGGDPVVLDCQEGSLNNAFSGDPTFVISSDFGEHVMAFGKYTSTGGAEISAGEVWLDLEYKYDKFAVVGTFNDGSEAPPLSSRAVLSPAIKIASCGKFKPKKEVKKGDMPAQGAVFNYTLGDLFRGEPKLDTYTPESSDRRCGSLEWTARNVDNTGQSNSRIDCRCLQLYGFDKLLSTEAVTSSDMYLIRRMDNQTSSAELVYVPFQHGDVTPDSSLSNAVMSSLQWRDIKRDQAASSTMSADEKVLQAWNFDNISAAYNDLCIALSGQQQHVMLRNASLSCIEYMQLSCLSVICDSQGASEQKSIEWMTTDIVAPMELQLYKFDTAEAESPDINTDYYIARRQTGTGPQLVYLPLSSIAISVDITPDADMSASQVSSLQWREVRTEQSAVVGKVMQAFNFNSFEDVYADAADALSNEQHLMLRNADTKRLEYLALSSVIPRVDSEGLTGQKSVSWLSGQHDEKELQLYGFDQEGEEGVSIALQNEMQQLLTGDYEFVVRKGGAGGEIAYTKISASAASAGAGVNVDSQHEELQTSSLECIDLSTEAGEISVAQMWNFNHMEQRYTELSDALSGVKDVVLRDCDTSCVTYISLSCLSAQSVSVDTLGSSGQKSISWLSGNGVDELQLYGMDEEGEELTPVVLSTTETDILPEDYEFVIRKNGAGGEITYAAVKLIGSQVSGTALADSDLEDSQTSSLESRELSSEDGVSTVIQLWNFNHFDQRYYDLSDALSSNDVVLRDTETSCVKYIALSALSSTPVSVDSEYDGTNPVMRSIQYGTYFDSPDEWLQLYGFEDPPAMHDMIKVTLSSSMQSLLTGDAEFLVRTTDERGWKTLEYKRLSAACVPGEVKVDSTIPDSQTSSLETRTVSSENGVSGFAQIWNFEHFDQRYYDLSDALSSNDVILRDTETSCVKYIALSALSADGANPDAEGESGQKSIAWLSGSSPQELQLYKMDEDGETLSAVYLGQTAQSLLPEDYEFVVRKNGAGGEISYATVEAASLSSAASRFQFGISINGSNASIGEGAVQIGGYTYFSNGGTVTAITSGTKYICVQCTMGYQAPTIEFVAFSTTQQLNAAQGDMTKYIFPIYKLVNGEVAVDYRPMPNAGCWEVAESQPTNGGN